MTTTVAVIAMVVVGVITTVLQATDKIRDQLLSWGWREDGYLGRSRRRSHQQRLRPALDAIGLNEDHFDALRTTGYVQAGVLRRRGSLSAQRPDGALLTAIRPWIVPLEGVGSFDGNSWYVDTMGATQRTGPPIPTLVEIADVWTTLLLKHGRIEQFDCVLGLKDGNPVLARDLCRRISRDGRIQPILAKGRNDPSRVRTDDGRHETDFEGLRAFLDKRRDIDPADRRYRAIALDDNATSGRSLATAIAGFNELVAQDPERYPFEPVHAAVVLFVVKAGDEAFVPHEAGISVHAMVALSDVDMQRIHDSPARRVAQLADELKEHEACEFSRLLPTLDQGRTRAVDNNGA